MLSLRLLFPATIQEEIVSLMDFSRSPRSNNLFHVIPDYAGVQDMFLIFKHFTMLTKLSHFSVL